MVTSTHRIRDEFATAAPSSTLAINEQSKALAKAGQHISRLGLGQSPFPIPPPVVQALVEHAAEKDYLDVAGLLELRQSIAKHLNKTRGTKFRDESILVGPGSKELLFHLQLVMDSAVILPTPSWVSYEPQAHFANNEVVWLKTSIKDSWRIDAKMLAKTCEQLGTRTKTLILNYPSNPSGITYSAEHLFQIADVAREHNVLIVADEIYWELSFEHPSSSIAAIYPEATIISTGLSKWCGAGGWRLGAFAFPDEYQHIRTAMIALASESFSAVSAPIQFAAIKAFDGGEEIDDYLEKSNRVLRVALGEAATVLRKRGVEVCDAHGGFYLMPDFSRFRESFARAGIFTDIDLSQRLIRDLGVATLPGSDFGLAPLELVLRLALVDFDGAQALDSLARASDGPDVETLDQVLSNMLRAVDAVADWAAQYGRH